MNDSCEPEGKPVSRNNYSRRWYLHSVLQWTCLWGSLIVTRITHYVLRHCSIGVSKHLLPSKPNVLILLPSLFHLSWLLICLQLLLYIWSYYLLSGDNIIVIGKSTYKLLRDWRQVHSQDYLQETARQTRAGSNPKWPHSLITFSHLLFCTASKLMNHSGAISSLCFEKHLFLIGTRMSQYFLQTSPGKS